MRGICIIASGNPYYGQWALNLCLSIKYSSPNEKVSLLYSGVGALHIQPYINFFDKVIELPRECYYSNEIESHVKTKTFLHDYSPYDETIYIDADVVWFPRRPISKLFEELKEVDFTMGSRDKIQLSQGMGRFQWANSENVLKMFGDKQSYNLSSEFIYFKKSEKVKEFFDSAKIFFDEPTIPYKRFNGGMPDELAFQMAMLKHDIYPHKEHFLPFYWEHYDKKGLMPERLYDNWYGYSMGGNNNTNQASTIYNNLAKFYSQHFGLARHFECKNKREIFPLRTAI